MKRFREKFLSFLDRHRLHLARRRAETTLAMLGVIVGLLAGTMIILFRLIIEALHSAYLPSQQPENFEALETFWRFMMPFAGGLLLAAGAWFLAPATRNVGIVHVLERLQYYEGHLPLRNILVQFVGGIIALGSGQSVGREGPSIHLGAGIASLAGQYLSLPNNCIRTLVACGSAAAIAASFNTPLAGVVFAMEVIVMEYTIAGFTPVILAAVIATVLSRAVFGEEPAFAVSHIGSASFNDMVYITIMGIVIGAASAGFVGAIRYMRRYLNRWPIQWVLPVVGLIVGALAMAVPEILGTGYDTVSIAMAGQMGVLLMAMVLLAKFAASVVCVAGRVPGGLIGPAIVMGSLAGCLYSQIINMLPVANTETALYTMLGMAAMMSAAIQAPLAGLLAVLEMTASPSLILPAMLAVVSANMAAKTLFGQRSVYLQILQDTGLAYHSDPFSQGLRRIGVTAVMNRKVVSCEPEVTLQFARQLLEREPQWIVIRQEEGRAQLTQGSALAAHLEKDDLPGKLNLLDVPGQRREAQPVHPQATLYEARRIMEKYKIDAVYVRRKAGAGSYRILGVLLQEDIQASYSLH